MALIELRQTVKHYGDLKAVDRVNLKIEEGQIMALLGPSGCGKTTVLRLVAGLERPDSGEIWLKGVPVSQNGNWVPAEKRQVGMVFQDYALFPHLTVRQNINFALAQTPRQQRQQRLAELLNLVGLTELKNRYPHQLSGGQQQRIALARAMAPTPDVILLDEPFSNLDAALRQSMREELRQILQQAHITTIFVTHDQEEALSLAQQVVVMFGGRVLQTGSPQDVYFRPRTKTVASFVGEASFIPAIANGETATSMLGTHPLQNPQHGEVDVLIRPEMLDIEADPEGPATVEHSIFLGHDQKLSLRFPNGSLLLARTRPQSGWAVGGRMRVTLTEALMAYPRTDDDEGF